MHYKFSFLLLFLGILTGCQARYLSVQTQYVSQENLASFHVGTPDAEKRCPAIGQHLLIEWSIPSGCLFSNNLTLKLKVRFKNHQEEEHTVNLKNRKGTYIYKLLNEKFFESGGIFTYKIEIWSDECVLDAWNHPLWADLITLDSFK